MHGGTSAASADGARSLHQAPLPPKGQPQHMRRPSADRERSAGGHASAQMHALLQPDLPHSQQQQQQQQQTAERPRVSQMGARRGSGSGSNGNYIPGAPYLPAPPAAAPADSEPRHRRIPSGDRAAAAAAHAYQATGASVARISPFQSNGLSHALLASDNRRGSGERRHDHSGLAGLLAASPLLHSTQQQQQQHPPPPPPSHSHVSHGRHTPEPPRGSYRLNPDEVVQPHPPSAPPAQRPPRAAPPHAAGGGRGPPPSAGAMGMHLHGTVPMLLQSQTPRIMFGDQATSNSNVAAGRNGAAVSSSAGELEHSRQGRPPHYPQQQQQQHQQHVLQQTHSQRHSEPAPAVGRGSLQHTIQSARSSAYSQLTLQQPNSNSNVAHLNSPSPNSTPVKSTFMAAQRERERDRDRINGGAGGGTHFDRLHIFDASPLSSPKEGARRGVGSVQQGPPHRTSSVRELGSAMFANRMQPAHGTRPRALSNVPVALSWPSELSGGGGHAHMNGAGGLPRHHGGLQPHVRNSLPLLSPPPAAAAAAAARNFPALRGAQLIESAPPVLSPELAHELQLDDYADDDDYFEDRRKLPPPDFSAAAIGGGGGYEEQRSQTHTQQGRSKPARVNSGARSGKKSVPSSSHTSASSAAAAAAGQGGTKRLDMSSASPFARPSSLPGGGGKGAVSKSRDKHGDVLPAEEWALSGSDDEDAPNTLPGTGDGDGGDGSDGTGGGGGDWLLDVGMAEDPNPRFRASMEDAHVIRRRFGPTFPRTHTTAPKHDSDSLASLLHDSSHPLPPSAPLRGSFFAVFDGHGGRATVDFLERHFHRALARRLRSSPGGGGGATTSASDVARQIEATFLSVDAAMAPSETPSRSYGAAFQDCGSTACVAYLRPCGRSAAAARELFLANVGDAQAVLAVDKKELQRGAIGSATPAAASAATNKKSKRGSNSTANRAPSPPPRGSGDSDAPASLDARTPKKAQTAKKSSRTGGTAAAAAAAVTAASNAASADSSAFAKTLPRGSSAFSSHSHSNFASTTRAVRLTAQPLSYAHVASDAKEVTRIKAAGGCVFANRVGGCLAVSRAFGDYALKSAGVSCVPYQQHVLLTPAHKFLIIGCDGVWDVMDPQTAVDAVAGMRDAQDMANRLVAMAIKRGTTDNVSCMVVRLHE